MDETGERESLHSQLVRPTKIPQGFSVESWAMSPCPSSCISSLPSVCCMPCSFHASLRRCGCICGGRSVGETDTYAVPRTWPSPQLQLRSAGNPCNRSICLLRDAFIVLEIKPLAQSLPCHCREFVWSFSLTPVLNFQRMNNVLAHPKRCQGLAGVLHSWR